MADWNKDGAVGDRYLLHLLLETFKESGMIGAGLFQRGGDTCRTQVADGGSRRAGETRNLVTGARYGSSFRIAAP